VSYLINGVPLDNATRGWNLEAGSQMRTDITAQAMALKLQGRDGVVAGLPADVGPSTNTLVVGTPSSEFGALYALIKRGGVLTSTEWPLREAVFEYLSHTVEEELETNDYLHVTFLIRLPGGYWRDIAETTTSSVSLSSASLTTDVMSGISAPVQDAVLRVKGATTGLQITDQASGAWAAYAPALTTAQWLRFESATGRAFITTTDVWTGGTEVSGDMDFGGPRGVFEITPYWAGTDPSARTGRLVVASATRTTASIQVRGKSAFVV
jgi:hypothetical protein